MFMKKTMFAVAAVAAAVMGCASKPDAEKPLKVLMIGNSFSICNLRKCPYKPSWMDAARAEAIKASVMDAVEGRTGR